MPADAELDWSKRDWPEAMAEVLTCRYEVRAGRALAFGMPAREHFHITYSYWAGQELRTGECFRKEALPAGTLFPVRYDPALPGRHQTGGGASSRVPLIALGLAGSVVLSMVWLLLLRGCG